jgi:hypothetical protein
MTSPRKPTWRHGASPGLRPCKNWRLQSSPVQDSPFGVLYAAVPPASGPLFAESAQTVTATQLTTRAAIPAAMRDLLSGMTRLPTQPRPSPISRFDSPLF